MALSSRRMTSLFFLLTSLFSVAQAAHAPLILQQALLAKNSTDTHAVPAIFGTPGQTINLIISSTSEKSWVYAPTFCASLAAGSGRRSCEASIAAAGGRPATALYNPESSSTWKEKANTFTYDGPNNQQKFVGTLGADNVKIGGINIPMFEFGVVTGTSVGDDEAASLVAMTGLDGGIGGVLGLGGKSNFLKYLVDNGMIKSSSIGVQLASAIIFDDAENVKLHPARRIVPYGTDAKEFPGNIILGGYDGDKIGSNATAGGLSGQNEIETTVMQFGSTWFDGADSNYPLTDVEYQAKGSGGSTDPKGQAVGIPAVIDSTSPFILMPQAFWDSVSGTWQRGALNKTTGRTYYTDRGGFRDWRNFTFDLMSKDGKKSQVVMQHFDWNVWDPEVNFWAPAFKLQPPGVNTLVLGRPAVRALYIAVDWDKREAKTQQLEKRTTESVKFVEVVSEAVRIVYNAFSTIAGIGVMAIGMIVGLFL